jgi:quercetin dioxygenase-like cupin family protein
MRVSESSSVRFLWPILAIAGCATNTPQLPYPAFVQADELPDIFMAGLPGIRAKQFVGNSQTGGSSSRLTLPADWKGSTGASPGKSVELYVISGEIMLGSMSLDSGGYAYIPPGFTGSNISSKFGAVLLYFLDDPDTAAVIRTPLILDSDLVDWRPVSENPEDFGFLTKELRLDPGSGAQTRLLRIEPGARQGWNQSTASEEGYLLTGNYRHSECIAGEVVTQEYTRGGYYRRPAGVVHGGPAAAALTTAVWYLREPANAALASVPACVAALPD